MIISKPKTELVRYSSVRLVRGEGWVGITPDGERIYLDTIGPDQNWITTIPEEGLEVLTTWHREFTLKGVCRRATKVVPPEKR